MRKAARKQRLRNYKESKKGRFPNFSVIFGYLGLGFLVFALLFWLVFPTRFWDGKSRTAVAVREETGDVSLVVFDPATDTITTFVLPANVEVEAARQLGTWKLNSLWQLGQNEKVGGSLLATSVTKSFGLPVEAWGDEMVAGLARTDFFSVVRSMIVPSKTNLTLKDRFGIGTFALGVKPAGRITIDLREAGVLRKVVLADGEEGYRIKEIIPSRIAAVFGDAIVSAEDTKVVVKYAGPNLEEAKEVGQTIQVLGAKVTSLLPQKQIEKECEVVGKKSVTREKIARLFSCPTRSSEEETLEVLLGEDFFKRY